MELKDHIDISRLPEHIAVIMDGNGRWAKERNRPRVFGHSNGVKSVREISEASAELGVKYLTLYAFSSENWNRPKLEVSTLMNLLVDTLGKEVRTLNENNIKLEAIGDIDKLPQKTYDALLKTMEDTRDNTRMTLILALNYSSRNEIISAVKSLSKDVQNGIITPEEINETRFKAHLDTSAYPDPELLIRTSGEHRISNYLLWQIAYTELCFLSIYWPDFRKKHLYQSIIEYQQRERRFGKTSEQLLA